MFVFTSDCSKVVVLVLFILCVALWLLAAGFISCFVLFVVLLDPVWHWDHIVEKKGASCYAFLWFVANVLSAVVLFLMTDSICHSLLPRTVLEKVTLTTI